jgi:hypothetical protein
VIAHTAKRWQAERPADAAIIDEGGGASRLAAERVEQLVYAHLRRAG